MTGRKHLSYFTIYYTHTDNSTQCSHTYDPHLSGVFAPFALLFSPSCFASRYASRLRSTALIQTTQHSLLSSVEAPIIQYTDKRLDLFSIQSRPACVRSHVVSSPDRFVRCTVGGARAGQASSLPPLEPLPRRHASRRDVRGRAARRHRCNGSPPLLQPVLCSASLVKHACALAERIVALPLVVAVHRCIATLCCC